MNVADILAKTKRVTIQLSNLCNYAERHDRCPVRTYKTIEILPSRVVYDIIDTLAACDFNRRKKVCFHVYNEPLIDPRLMMFITYLRSKCDKIGIHLWSNGWYLDQGLAKELIDAGVTKMTLSAYTSREYERFQKMADDLALMATWDIQRWKQLKKRVMAVDDIVKDKYKPCRSPWSDLVVRASGQLGLCCLDWREDATFGSVYREALLQPSSFVSLNGFGPALERAYPEMEKLNKELLAGERNLAICRQCQWHR